jgi:hypothetical protein
MISQQHDPEKFPTNFSPEDISCSQELCCPSLHLPNFPETVWVTACRTEWPGQDIMIFC